MKRYSVILGLATAIALVSGPANAETSVTIASATQTGTQLVVSGTATFEDAQFVTLGTDGIGDTFTPGIGPLGGDMTAAAMATQKNGSILFQWIVSDMPPAPLNGSPTGIVFAWNFCVGDDCFELDVGRTAVLAQTTDPYVQLWRCADPTCDPGDQTFSTDSLTGEFDAATMTVTVTAPRSTVSASPGELVTFGGWSAQGPVFTDVMDGSLFPIFDIGDGVPSLDDYSIPVKAVSLELDAPGLDPATVAYTGSPVTPAANGSFSSSLNISELAPGEYEVYARACFGQGNCGYGSLPVTIA